MTDTTGTGSDGGRPAWVPADIDLETPNSARMYDYYLGGAHHFAADRRLAEEAIAVLPWMREAVRANRGFLRRGVTACARAGIRQFVDLGSGIPTVGATHDIARRIVPDARVVYVDDEPVAHAHSRLLLADVPGAEAADADLTSPDDVRAHPAVRSLIDWSQPVAVLTLAVFHFVEDPAQVTAVLDDYRAGMATGSHLLFSHATADHHPDEGAAAVSVYTRSSNPVHNRTHAELVAMLSGFDLLEPGLVDATAWRRDAPHDGEHTGFYAALATPRSS